VSAINAAIIAAGGLGARMRAEKPKQFLEINGKPLIIYSLETFENHGEIGEIVAVCPEDYFPLLKKTAAEYKIHKLIKMAAAGVSRQASVYNGLKLVSPDTDIVIVHDAARPFVTLQMITDNIRRAAEHGACGTVLPAEDTIVTADDRGFINAFTPREVTFHMQTPQGFEYKILLDAHKRFAADPPATDDCSLAMRAGVKVAFVGGDKSNIKITTPEDISLMQIYLGKQFT